MKLVSVEPELFQKPFAKYNHLYVNKVYHLIDSNLNTKVWMVVSRLRGRIFNELAKN